MEVINMKDAPVGWERNSRYVYIGRKGYGHDGYWGNPYGKRETLDDYEKYLVKRLQTDLEFWERFSTLRNKILVCFCKPKRCHGDIIIKYLERYYGWS
jgi:hypothetical protein